MLKNPAPKGKAFPKSPDSPPRITARGVPQRTKTLTSEDQVCNNK